MTDGIATEWSDWANSIQSWAKNTQKTLEFYQRIVENFKAHFDAIEVRLNALDALFKSAEDAAREDRGKKVGYVK